MGCASCEGNGGPPGCHWGCAVNTNLWHAKCAWTTCMGCTACAIPLPPPPSANAARRCTVSPTLQMGHWCESSTVLVSNYVGDELDCRRTCEERAGCGFYSHWVSTGWCHLTATCDSFSSRQLGGAVRVVGCAVAASMKCNGGCEANTWRWPTKCLWDNCAGCEPCALPPEVSAAAPSPPPAPSPSPLPPAAPRPHSPNIVFILADDMGYGDIGANGDWNAAPTPHLDAIAREGVRFTDGYVTAPSCGPSRHGLFTGAYPQRFGSQANQYGLPDHAHALPAEHKLLPEALSAAGHVTCLVGKWNLHDMRLAHDVFDEVFDLMDWGGGYWPENDGTYSRVDGAPARWSQEALPHWARSTPGHEYLTDRITRHAADFIVRHRDDPFFLYVGYNAPHSPWQAKVEYNITFSHISSEPKRIYAGMVAAMDEGVGELMRTLREQGLDAGRTMVAFSSDNGAAFMREGKDGWESDWPSSLQMGSSGPFAGAKWHFTEGGNRVPFLLRWPGVLAAGSVYSQPVMTFDLFPTFVAAAGGRIPAGTDIDAPNGAGASRALSNQFLLPIGVNLLPFLDGRARGRPHDRLFWGAFSRGAVRQGNMK